MTGPLLLFRALGLSALAYAAIVSVQSPESGLPRHDLGVLSPSISPTGDRIAVSYHGAIWILQRTGPDAGRMRRITHSPGYDDQPVWTPDERRIAFSRRLHAGEPILYFIDLASGRVSRFEPETTVGRMFFDPAGERMFGHIGRANTPGGYKLAWLDLQSGGDEPIELPGMRVVSYAPSPDGTRIVFSTRNADDGEQNGFNGPRSGLWLHDLKTKSIRQLRPWPAQIYDLFWSARGILFSSALSTNHQDLWIVSPDGAATPRKLTHGQSDETMPSATRDGRWIAYTDNQEGATGVVVRDDDAPAHTRLVVGELDFGRPVGRLSLETTDARTNQFLIARVSLWNSTGKLVALPGAPFRISSNTSGPHGAPYFYPDRPVTLTVPEGRYQLQVKRGIEYLPVEKTVDVVAGKTTSASIALERWIDMPERSWFAGESHIHANYLTGVWNITPESALPQIVGEDLNAANFVIANAIGHRVFDRDRFRGQPDWHSTDRHTMYWNQEFRSTLWGHMSLWNLKYLVEPMFTGFKDTPQPWDVPTNGDVADLVHIQGGLVSYTHPQATADAFSETFSAKGLPIDVALGKIDTLDINYPDPPAFKYAVPLWYRFLNLGFHLPASAGSDCFLDRVFARRMLGSSRAYVFLDGKAFTYVDWVAALQAGRSFVTSGPVLEFAVENLRSGSRLELSTPRRVRVTGWAEYRNPLGLVDVIVNGKVAQTVSHDPDERRATLDASIAIEHSGWIGLRVTAKDGTEAHASPVYVELEGRPVASPDDARFFLNWIETLQSQIEKRKRLPTPEARARVQRQLGAARAVYGKLADRSY